MWRRLRRRTLAPSRPVVFPEQWPLVVVTVVVLVGCLSIVAVVLID